MTNKVADQWRSRVSAVLEDIANVKAEMKSLDEQTAILATEHTSFTNTAKKERVALQAELKAAEQRALIIDKSSSQSHAMRAEAEGILTSAAREYEDMSSAIRRLRETEDALQNRENLRQTLENESTQWAEEEHRLRTALQNVETQIRNMRKAERATLATLEQQAREAESDLNTARRSRNPDAGFEPVTLPTSAPSIRSW